MKLYSISAAIRSNPYSKDKREVNSNRFIPISSPFACDVVSFSRRNYSSKSVLNPTGHCAYCGCKVYTEDQISSIAQEMLSLKADRLQGKVRSVLEKLSEGKNSQEISTAKRIENDDEIEFFSNFLDMAGKKAFLKGEEIFKDVYKLEKDEAHALLVKNMHPLMKTIDHVSPQNKDQDNNNVDANLVEACYCCNHDLKKGSSFYEFYTMFPTIKNNMPRDKFDFAMAELLDSSQPSVKQRLSVSNILKHLNFLFVEREEATAYLDSIDLRIKNCNDEINSAIAACRQDIDEKQAELDELGKKLTELEQDSEYQAMIKRSKLEASISASKTTQEGLKSKKSRIQTAINNLITNKKTKRQKRKQERKTEITSQLSDEEKNLKLANLRTELDAVSVQIEEEEKRMEELQQELEVLNEEHPTIQMFQAEKSRAENAYNAHLSLEKEKQNNADLHSSFDNLSELEDELQAQLSGYPAENFALDAYSKEAQETFSRYKKLQEALDYIAAHPNGSYVKGLINEAARKQITQEFETLSAETVVADYNAHIKKTKCKEELDRVREKKSDISRMISNSEEQIQRLEAVSSVMTKQEAAERGESAAKSIRVLTEKQNLMKIPQRISTLKAEIEFLNSTILDLKARQTQIFQTYNQ